MGFSEAVTEAAKEEQKRLDSLPKSHFVTIRVMASQAADSTPGIAFMGVSADLETAKNCPKMMGKGLTWTESGRRHTSNEQLVSMGSTKYRLYYLIQEVDAEPA